MLPTKARRPDPARTGINSRREPVLLLTRPPERIAQFPERPEPSNRPSQDQPAREGGKVRGLAVGESARDLRRRQGRA